MTPEINALSTLMFGAVMLLLIFDTPRKLLTLALFWAWQLALIFSYLHVRKKSEKRYVLWIFLLLSLLPLIFTKLSVFVKELYVFSMLTEKEGCLLCWKAFAGLKKMGNALVYKL